MTSAAPAFRGAREVILQGIERRIFPAAVLEVGTGRQAVFCEAFGRLTYDPTSPAATADTVFDLASLTKVLATTPLVMRLLEQGHLALDDPVARHLPSWIGPDRASVTIRDLLAHCSGLPAYRPLYETLAGRPAIERAISTMPLEYAPRSRSVYSDLDFILLGFMLEDAAPLPLQFDALCDAMGHVEDLRFHPPAAWLPRTAPTRHNPWRGRLTVGEVDDDNAWALGGVAGHAGLFGTAEAVGAYARHLLGILEGRPGAFRRETLQTFTSCRRDIFGSSRALGWDTMLPTSSCGTRMSPRAFGHTGFTGTSLWIDPDRGLYVVLLTNRVHPTPGDPALIHQVRRAVHDAVVAEFDRWDRDYGP
jgi:CubicO group peptidase (beta-lactamase class C family)